MPFISTELSGGANVDVDATAIGMRGVKLTLEENDDGQDNWAFGDGSGSGFGWGDVLPYLKTIEVEDVLINYAVAGEEPLQIGLHKAQYFCNKYIYLCYM